MAAPAGWRFLFPLAVVLWGPVVLPELAAEPIRDVPAGPSAEDLVNDALKAEAAGKPTEREKLLRMALEKDPDCAPARWHSGYVRAGKEWLPWDEVQRQAASDPRIAGYRRRFDEQAGTPAGELALARWCREQGLEDHARFHWLRLLNFQPQNEEALKALGMRWYQGQLLTHEQIVAKRGGQGPQATDRAEQGTSLKEWGKHWAPRLTRWQRMIREGDPSVDSSMREEIGSVGKPGEPDFWPAMQALNAMLMTRCQSKKDEAACRALSLKWVRVLDGMGERPGILFLVWNAVDHPLPEVRAAAADALKKRPQEAYVPLLLARMQSPVEASFAMRPRFGSVAWEYTFYREGPVADVRVSRAGSVDMAYVGPSVAERTYPWGQDPARDQLVRNGRAVDAGRVNRAAAALTAQAATRAAVAARQVQQAVFTTNVAVAELNGRIRDALTRATGTDCGESAPSWWKWWEDSQYAYYDLEKPSPYSKRKAVYEYSSVTAAHMPVQSSGVTTAGGGTGHSCFARGTIVWTLTGPAAIDTLKVGDRVLSQHPVTGELAYQPVLGTTTRRLRTLMKVSLGSETIASTRGHPFLVAGEGWKLARELKVGMLLHSPSGPVLIDGVEDLGEQKPFYERLKEKPKADAGDDLAYNLVVHESHTYFVGTQRVLVFDDRFAALANAAMGNTASAR